jgi:deoxyribose-phosphate aldolase
MNKNIKTLSKMIDHSLLHPALTSEEMTAGVELAIRYDVASVCIKPYAVPLAVTKLHGSEIKVGTVIGFPHGNSHIDIKRQEAEIALDEGAVEIDMVVNIGQVISENWEYVSEEIGLINQLATDQGGLLKVIFENDFLSKDELKIRLCHICNEHQVAFVKTSTGYGFVKESNGCYRYQGATDYDLALMRRECYPTVQVKAAGGIRSLDDLLRVKALGVTRVGATATAAILDEAQERGYS